MRRECLVAQLVGNHVSTWEGFKVSNKVDIVVSHIKEKIPGVKRLNARIIIVKIVLDIKLLNIINAYAPH